MSTTLGASEISEGPSPGGRRVDVTAHITGHATQTFTVSSTVKLLELMEHAATLGGFALLPPMQRPFDRLHSMTEETVGPVIDDLDKTLADYLRQPGHEPHFTVELARAIHVNTRWDEAPREEMSPREILALAKIHLDPTQYSLYRPESSDPLPPDAPIRLERGTDLEAQRDGKYGEGR